MSRKVFSWLGFLVVEKLEVGLFPCHEFFVVRFFRGKKFHGIFFRDIGFLRQTFSW